MTTANRITIARILLVPFFIVEVLYYVDNGNEWHRFFALLSFALAALSDAIDGYIARRYDQRSELGAILDPMADKLLLISGVVLLSLHNEPHLPRIPIWLAGVILGRDVILLLGLVIIHYACGKVRVRPILLGKIATVLQMATVIWGLLKWSTPVLGWCATLAALTTAGSGIFYILDGIRQLSASPSSAASPKQ